MEKDLNVRAKSNEFIWVKCFDQKVAKEYGIKASSQVIVLDPDGDKIGEGATNAMPALIDQVGKVWCRKSIDWGTSLPDALSKARDENKLVVAAWTDDKKTCVETLSKFEDKIVAKLHERFVFVKLDVKSDAAKECKVISAPTVLILDPKLETGKPVDKATGALSERSAKDLLLKALRKVDDGKKR